MARASSGTKFASVNLNKSYGKPASAQSTGAGGTAPGIGLALGAGRSRLGSSNHGGMLLLTRPGAAAPKGSKLAVPLPVNLPSLRREHAGNDPTIALVGGGAGGPGWSKQQQPEEAEAEGTPGSAPSPANAAALSRPQPQGGPSSRSAVYAAPGTRPLSRSGTGAATTQVAEKAVLLRGEDFPTLQATLPLRPVSPQQRQKQQRNQDSQAHRSGHKQQQENGECAPQDRRPAPAREPLALPQRGISPHQEGVPQSQGQPPSAGAYGGSIQSSTICSRPGAREDGYGSGPPPFIGVGRSSNWTDDEREPGARPSSTGYFEFTDHAERDFYRDQVHHGDRRTFHAREGRSFGPSSGNGAGKDDSRPGNAGGYGRDNREPFSRGHPREVGDPRDRGAGRERSDARDSAFGRVPGSVAEESVGIHRGFGREPEVTRENGSGADREKFWSRHPGSERDSFTGKDRAGLRFSPGYGHVRDGSDTFPRGGRAAGGAPSSLFPGKDDTIRGRYDNVSAGVFGSGRGMLGFDHGREKQSGLAYSQSFGDESVVGGLTIPNFHFLSSGMDARNRGLHKRREVAEEVFHDPERDFFEAELERVQRQQELDRLHKIEEKERAALQAKKEEEEQKRLALEEEEKRTKQEMEARDALVRAEQQALEAARKAAQEKLVREEERKLRQLEEERRKENARRKLVELEERIAQRERERLAEQNRQVDAGSQISGPPAPPGDTDGRYRDGKLNDGDQMISRASGGVVLDKDDRLPGPGRGLVISPVRLRYVSTESSVAVHSNESVSLINSQESGPRMVTENRVQAFNDSERSDPYLWRNDQLDGGHWAAPLSQMGRVPSDGSLGEVSGPRHSSDRESSPKVGAYSLSGRNHGDHLGTKDLEDPQTRRWASSGGHPQSKYLYPRTGSTNYDSFFRSSLDKEGVRRWGRDKFDRARTKDGIQRFSPPISASLPEPEPDVPVGRLRNLPKQPHVLPPPPKALLKSFPPKSADNTARHVVESSSREHLHTDSSSKSSVSVSGSEGPAEHAGGQERPVEPSALQEKPSSHSSHWESLFSQQDKMPQHVERPLSPSLRPHGTFAEAFRAREEHVDKRHQLISADEGVSRQNNVTGSCSSPNVIQAGNQGVIDEGLGSSILDSIGNTSHVEDSITDKVQVEDVQILHIDGEEVRVEDNKAPPMEDDVSTPSSEMAIVQPSPMDGKDTADTDKKVESRVVGNAEDEMAQLLDPEGSSYRAEQAKEREQEQKEQDSILGQQPSEKKWQVEQAREEKNDSLHPNSKHSTSVVTAISSTELYNSKHSDGPQLRQQMLPRTGVPLPQSGKKSGSHPKVEPTFTEISGKDEVALQVRLRPGTYVTTVSGISGKDEVTMQVGHYPSTHKSSVSGTAIHIGSIPMPLHPFEQLGLNTFQPPLFQFGQLGEESLELSGIEKANSLPQHLPSPQQRQSPDVHLADSFKEQSLFGSDVFQSGPVDTKFGKSFPLEPSKSSWMTEYVSSVGPKSSDAQLGVKDKKGHEIDGNVLSVVSQPSHSRVVGDERSLGPAEDSLDASSSLVHVPVSELDTSGFSGEVIDNRWQRSVQGRIRHPLARSAGAVGRGRGRNNPAPETIVESDVSLFGTVPMAARPDAMGLKSRTNKNRHRKKMEGKDRESGTSGDRDYFSAYDSNMQQAKAYAIDTAKPSWFPSGESGVKKDRTKDPWSQVTEKKASISSRHIHSSSGPGFPQRSRKFDRSGSSEAIRGAVSHGSSDGLLGKYGSSEVATDFPLHNGGSHESQQPGISAPIDEDDFIEVRSKRQMLNDKREQREREKAKTMEIKAKDHMGRKERGGFKSGFLGDQGGSIHASKSSSNPNKERRLSSTVPTAERQLESISTRSGATSSVSGSSRIEGGESVSVSAHEAQVMAQQSLPTTTITWGNVRSTLEVVGLPPTQHEDAKKPVISEASMHSKIHGRDRGTTVVESSPPVSISSAEDKMSAAVPSLFGLFSAGDNIQFGAVIPPSLLLPSSHILTPTVSSVSSSAPGFRHDGPSDSEEQRERKSGSENDVNFGSRGKRTRSDTMIMDVVKAGVGAESGSGADAEAEAEAEAEAAASAVAVAAISADEPYIQSRHSNSQSSVAGPANSATGKKGSYRQTVTAPGSIGLAMGVHRMPQNPMPEDSVSVALPSDLSVETSTLLRGTTPSQGLSGQVFASMSGAQSPFPGPEVGSMLGGPVFGFQTGEEVVSGPRQGQDASVREHGVVSMGAGGWRQHVGVVDSLYGTPPSSFSGAGAFMNSGIPSIQGAPHMLVYTNPFAPLNQFGQLGFMGPTYLPSGKQPDWKHTPLSSNTGVVGMSSEVGGLVSQHNSGMSGADVPLQSQWSHVPGLPLHSPHLSSSLLGFSLQPRNRQNPHASMDLLPPNSMEGMSSLSSAGAKGSQSNGPLRFVDSAVARFPDELGFSDLVSSHMAEATPSFPEVKSSTSVAHGIVHSRMPRSRRPTRVARGGDVRSAGLNGSMKGTNGILGASSGQRTSSGQSLPPDRHNLGSNEQLPFGQAIGIADRSGVIAPGSVPKTGAKGAGWNGQASRKAQGAGKQPSYGSSQGERLSSATSRLKQVYVVKPSVAPSKRSAAANGNDPSGRAGIFTPIVGNQEG